MLSYIVGELAEVQEGTIVVENNGIGYNVQVSSAVIDNLPDVGEMVKIYTYLHVREDAISIYGFLTRDELNVFKMLLNVSGIGPKNALAVLSTLSVDDLRFAVLSDDVTLIKTCPGIGLKSAQRIIIDLKDKLKLKDVFEGALAKHPKPDRDIISIRSEAVEALTTLGYSNKEAMDAVKRVDDIENKDSETILKEALKFLAVI